MTSNLATLKSSELFTLPARDGEIGCGSFATVRFCKNLSSQKFAVKCFKLTGSTEEIKIKVEKGINEANILRKAAHPHIMEVHGTVEWDNYFGVVIEYLAGGNLDDLLRNKTLKDIPWCLRLRMVLQLSEALSYLHNYRPAKSLIHGDVKPENILLTNDLVVKLSDFGSVNLVKETGASTTTTNLPNSHQHTLYYTAPEYLIDILKDTSPKRDVFSFGIILYEFVTRTRPYENAVVHQTVIIHVIKDIGQRPDRKCLDEIRTKLSLDDLQIFKLLIKVMEQCWSQQPSDRPEMQTVRDSLCIIFDQIDHDTIKQQIRNVVERFGRKEKDFDTREGIPLSSISSDPDDITYHQPFSPPSNANATPTTSGYSVSVSSTEIQPSITSEGTEMSRSTNQYPEENSSTVPKTIDAHSQDENVSTVPKTIDDQQKPIPLPCKRTLKITSISGEEPTGVAGEPAEEPSDVAGGPNEEPIGVADEPYKVPTDFVVISITKRDESGLPVLDEDNLKRLLINTEASDIPVAFYVICGEVGTEKSFLWSQLVHYLKDKNLFFSNVKSNKNFTRFFDRPNTTYKQKEGICVLNRPFILRTSNYDKIAFFLMDTRSIMSGKEREEYSGMIFTLSCLISSLQFYNVKCKIASQHFQYIYNAVQILESVKASNPDTKHMQSLMFLVKDWKRKECFPLGLEGGTSYIKHELERKDSYSDIQQDFRNEITKSFQRVSGFLLPYPGDAVLSYSETLSLHDQEEVDKSGFYQYFKELFEHLCHEDNIVLKTVNNRVVVGRDFYAYIVECAQTIACSDVTKLLETFVEIGYRKKMRKLIYNLLKDYESKVSKTFLYSHVEYIEDIRSFDKLHQDLKDYVIQQFDKSQKPGQKPFHNRWRKNLEILIEKNYNTFKICRQSEISYASALQKYQQVLSTMCSQPEISYASALEKYQQIQNQRNQQSREDAGDCNVLHLTKDTKERSAQVLNEALQQIKNEVDDELIAEQCCFRLKCHAKLLFACEYHQIISDPNILKEPIQQYMRIQPGYDEEYIRSESQISLSYGFVKYRTVTCS